MQRKIAIIGYGANLPGAVDANVFFQNLMAGKHVIEEIPAAIFNIKPYYFANKTRLGKTVNKWGSFVKSVSDFTTEMSDKTLYSKLGFSQKLLLDVVCQAIFSSGKEITAYQKMKCAVVIAASSIEQALADTDTLTFYSVINAAPFMLSNCVSYLLNLNGISLTLDTGQSSSLVALSEACRHLQDGDLDCAIVGGVNLINSVLPTIAYSQAGLQSADGFCKSFSDTADGFVRGEGGIAFVLKTLDAAERDGDYIYAVIHATSVNHSGYLPAGIVSPNKNSQKQVIKTCLENAKIDPEQIAYIEAHGSGTTVGDVIEFQALSEVLAEITPRKGFCGLGSVKSYLGHLEAAAGFAGLLKAVLMLDRQSIAPSFHFDEPNAQCDFIDSPLYFSDQYATRAISFVGVNSVGLGGTNAHTLLGHYANRKQPVTQSNATNSRIERESSLSEISTSTIESPEDIVNVLNEFLNIEINAAKHGDIPFVDLGVNSLIASEIITQLQTKISIDLPATLLFDYATINALSKYLIHQPLQREHSESVTVSASVTREDIDNSDDIAIVGLSLRAAGADDLNQFWANLVAGNNGVSLIPQHRWNYLSYYQDKQSDADGSIYCKYGAFLKNIDEFDADFFRISPKEATAIDPQQRLLLELVWECLDQAGMVDDEKFANTGVYIGASYTNYRDGMPSKNETRYSGIGNSNAIIANRISYFFNLNGPSLVIDTLCSSSLVALDMATKQLRAKQCDQALVGAAHIALSPYYYQRYCRLQALSALGRCASFSEGGDGFVPGEGAVMVLLKPLKKAIAAQDNILAVIKGSAVNHGGQASGLTAPNAGAQKKLITSALRDAKLTAEHISYIEAHGTGTELGDPIEISGLTQAFRESTEQKQFCGIGSVKTNIGHTEPAAGLMGVAKVIMAFKHRYLPGNIHLSEPNRHIDFIDSPFYLVDHGREWNSAVGQQRRAGVSAFGIGGANAHVILEEWNKEVAVDNEPIAPHLILLSARSESALQQCKAQLLEFIKQNKNCRLADLAFSLAVGRKHFEYRYATFVNNIDQLMECLPAGENKQQFVHPLSDQYIQGKNIDWSDIFKNVSARRIITPGYPFERKSYWINTKLAFDALTRKSLNISHQLTPTDSHIFVLNPNDTKFLMIEAREISFDRYSQLDELNAGEQVAIICGVNNQADAANVYKFITSISIAYPDLKFHIFIAYQLVNNDYYNLIYDGIAQAINSELKNIRVVSINVQHEESVSPQLIHYCIQAPVVPARMDVDEAGVYFYESLPYLAQPKNTTSISKRDVFVITGGNGGIATALTKYLIEKYHCRVILLSKSKECEFLKIHHEAYWHDYVAYYSVDITDREKVADVFAILKNKYQTITGIIHLAGSMDKTASLMKKTFEAVYAIARVKIDGTLNILHSAAKLSPAFILMNSSIATLETSLSRGKSGYVVGNTFMNSLAQTLSQHDSMKIKTIIWPAWHGVGMMNNAVDTALADQWQIDLRTGLEYFDYYLKHVHDLPAVSIVKSQVKTSPLLTAQTEQVKMPLAHSDINPQKSLLAVISKVIGKALTNDDIHIPFSAFGIDSLMLADVINELETEHHIQLNAADLLEYDTVEKLTNYVNQAEKKLIKIETAIDEVSQIKTVSNQKIAVIGMACQFPDAHNVDKFWSNLISGKCSIREIPHTRWPLSTFYSQQESDVLGYAQHAALIDNIWDFDAKYFNFKDKEADVLDPQQRMFLKLAYELFTDAGFEKASDKIRRTGVFVGARMNHYGRDYFTHIKKQIIRDKPYPFDRTALLGRSQNFIAAWVADRFDLHGPALVVDTACSSSLMSLHLACKSLLNNECEMAIAGGVDLLLDEQMLVLLSKAKALSPDGLVKTFDRDANGYVIGEGAGAVLLKPLEQALADGDSIYCVISASGVNNDGHTMGITTPNINAQEELLTAIYQQANINPRTISYMEAHGTGTQIGDPIELQALTRSYRRFTQDKGFCAIGSVKTNIGHLHSAAGISAVIKCALSLYNKQLVPSLHCNEPNSRLNLLESPFYVNSYLRKWDLPTNIPLRRAGISSFGFGGTNVHVVVEECAAPTTKRMLDRYKFQEKVHKMNYKNTLLTQLQHPLIDDCQLSQDGKIQFARLFSFNDMIMSDHKVDNKKMLPGVTWLEMVRAAFMHVKNNVTAIKLKAVVFHSPLVLLPGQEINVQGVIDGEHFEIKSDKIHVTGEITAISPKQEAIAIKNSARTNLVDQEHLFSTLRKLGYIHAGFFRNVVNVDYHSDQHVTVKLHKSNRSELELSSYWLDPGLMDSATLGPFVTTHKKSVELTGCPFVPLCIDELEVYQALPSSLNADMDIHLWNNETGRVSITFYDDEHVIYAKANNLAYKRYPADNKVINEGDVI